MTATITPTQTVAPERPETVPDPFPPIDPDRPDPFPPGEPFPPDPLPDRPPMPEPDLGPIPQI